MSDERFIDRIVTKFFVDTCQPCEQQLRNVNPLSMRVVDILVWLSNLRPKYDEVSSIQLVTGSVAEFYIEPMLSCVGDVDVMCHTSRVLAIPRGHPPPTQLPAEFHNYVMVFEIIDSHLPGYVYLKLRYLLTECNDDSKYNSVEYDREVFTVNTPNIPIMRAETHGPARRCKFVHRHGMMELPTDIVSCKRCLVWPPQATDWPTRHRNYNWPDSATLDSVVSNGCDVVCVAHRLCKEHKWMGKYQHRLSFSRAEIVLINSWMPVQQIVYHMLRYFIKTERLTDCADNSGAGTLSNYHIKTLMLWACELKPSSWWIEELNVIKVCVQLLRTLAVWLADARYPHYFLDNCNLIDDTFYVGVITNQLLSLTETWLSTWFIHMYIRKCSQLCPGHVSQLMDDVSSSMKLQNAVSAIVEWRQINALKDMTYAFIVAEYLIPFRLLRSPLTVPSCVCWIMELPKIDVRLVPYFLSIAFLHVANRLSKSGSSDELVNILATVLGHFIDTRRTSYQSSVRSLFKAAKLMKVVANKPFSTVSLIEIELSKAYLYRALRCKDSDSDSIYCLANVYLAVLYYIKGQYQTAIDHCTMVTRSQDHSQCSSRVVQGEILPKIDDNTDSALGLSVFYQYVRSVALNQQQTQHVSVFTTELFAYNLDIKCRQFMKSPPTEGRQCINYNGKAKRMLVADVLDLKLTRNYQHKIARPTTNPSSMELIELVQKCAIEHLTTYRRLEVRDFGSRDTIVTTDFEALYAYKLGDYQWCLQLSTENVHTLLYVRSGEMYEVSTSPDFNQLLDQDIVALTALTLMVDRKCRGRTSCACISQLTLSLYLMTQCQLKLHHSVTTLAQTLEYIEFTRRGHRTGATLDLLTLKLSKCKAVMYIADRQIGL